MNRRRSAPRTGALRHFVGFGALMAMIAIVFRRALSAGTIWDDAYLTVRNTHLGSWSGIRVLVTTDIWSSSVVGEPSGYYRPVASLSFALNRLVAGNTALAYHAGNVLLHALVAALLLRFIVVREIATGARALACVVLVTTMPLVAEPVSWIAGRYDLIGTFFALGAFEANRWKARTLAVPIPFVLAVLSKEPFAALPILLVLDDVLVVRRSTLREIPKYAALAVAFGASLVLRAWANVPQPTVLLAQGGLFELVRAYAFALKTFGALAVHPVDLCFFRTYVPPTVAVTMATIAAALTALALAFFWWRRAPWRASHGAVLFGVLWCAIALVPATLAAPSLRIIGDRYAYFSLAGASVALAGLLEGALRGAARRVVPALVFGLAIAQSFRLQSRLGELQSEDSMFSATLARDPDNFTSLLLYGQVLAHRGEYQRAEELLLHARAVAPMDGDIDVALAFVHLNQRRFAEAEADGWRSIATKPDNPRAWVNLASALVDNGKPGPAVEMATRALAIRPRFAYAHVIRAIALLKLGRVDAAHDDVVAALAIDPTNAQALQMQARFHERASP